MTSGEEIAVGGAYARCEGPARWALRLKRLASAEESRCVLNAGGNGLPAVSVEIDAL